MSKFSDPTKILSEGADVNKNDFQDKFSGYGFIDFLICLPSKKKNNLMEPLKQLKSCVYLNKTAYFNPKTFVPAHFRIFK